MIRPAHIASLALFCSVAANARTHVVHRGGSIRAALAAAHPGDTVEVDPGVYREGAPGDLNALTVTTPGIRLIGRGHRGAVILENAGGQQFGVWVSPANSAGTDRQGDPEKPPCGTDGPLLRGFTIEGFTIRGFLGHGVHLACVDGFRIANNVSEDNRVYGLFPVLSRNGVVTDNVVRGTFADAGIYVGQSDRVLISDNRASDNLLGLEVENSRDCAVIGNELSGNTLGIIVDVLFDKIKLTAERTVVAFNRVRGNNRANSAETGDLIAILPSGIGILLLGSDSNTVFGNQVEDNGFAGIAVASLCLAFQPPDFPVCPKLEVDPDPDQNRIIHNQVTNNGGHPTHTPLDALMGDLVWDGSGKDDCWGGNRTTRGAPPLDLPACH